MPLTKLCLFLGKTEGVFMMKSFTKGLSAIEMQVVKLFRHARQNSYGSRKRYMNSCMVFARYLSDVFKLQNIANVANKHMVAFIKHRQELGMAPKTIKNDLAAIRYMHDLISNPRNVIAPNDVLKQKYGLDLEKTPAVKGNRAWTKDEYTEALTFANIQLRNEEHDVMVLCRYMGFRITEASAATRAQAEMALKLGWYQVKGEAKNGKWRAVPLNEHARSIFKERLKSTEPGGRLFCKPGEKVHKVVNRFEKWLENNRYSFETQEGQELRTWEKYGESHINELTYHGLRFCYVQERVADEMAKGYSDEQACHIVSKEIGHNRTEVIKIYRAGEKKRNDKKGPS